MKKHIIFDLDGTLIDSAKGIYNAFVQSCEKVGLIPTSLKNSKIYWPSNPDHCKKFV